MISSKKNILLILTIAFLVVLLRTAWVGDDSYITMRSVDNFVNGYGLTWNPGTRVQTYTHPLWMMFLTFLYFFTHHAYGSLILLSITFSIATFVLVLNKVEDDMTLFLGWCMLVLSNAFVDYSTSGLENPLSHFLLIVFALLYIKFGDHRDGKQLFAITFVMGLTILNRIDLALIVLPPLFEIVARKGVRKQWWIVILGFSPLILWEFFSLIYYGFPFPNTYYAKLHTGIASQDLAKQGLLYFFNSIAWDPITLSLIVASLLLSLLHGNKQRRVISIGIVMYLLYILKIGGDFMSGRFFSAPFILSVFLLLMFLEKTDFKQKMIIFVVVAFLGAMAHTVSFLPPLTRDDYMENLTGVSDEQAYYYSGTGLLMWGSTSDLPRSPWVDEGSQLNENEQKVFVGKGIGFLGYYAGPNVHVIDYFALSDPLLSHLPVISKRQFLIGHFRRPIPKGYIETLESGTNQIQDPNLAKFYEKLVLVTQGPVWNLARWEVIWKINTGQYDYLWKGSEK